MMRKICALLLLLSIPLAAGTITKTIVFSENELHFTEVDGYDVVTMPYQGELAEPGKPLLPLASVYFLIPPDAEITNVEVLNIQELELDGQYNIHPAQNPVPFSRPDLYEFTPPNPIVYNSNTPYPAKTIKMYESGIKSGFRIAGVDIYPLHYLPSNQKLIFTKSMTLKIEYKKNRHTVSPLSQVQYDIFSSEVAKLITNSEDIPRFAPHIRRGINDVNYVIITSSSYQASFQALADWRTKQGWKAEIVTTTWIYSNYSGYDNPERIRNFLKDYFATKGLVWAFIGGDNDIVPVRTAYLPFSGNSYIATDLYYSDLDGTWDQNGNHLYGEMSGDGVDLYADIFVGRLCCASTSSVTNYLSKQNTFEMNPPTTYLRKMLLPAVQLFSGYHGSIPNGYIADTTPAGWFDCIMNNPPNYRMRDSLNQGYQFCHPAAHGDQYGLYTQYGGTIFHRSQIASLSNGTNYNIMNSIACYSGDFDQYDCLAESLVNKYPGACVATIMNTRYGWGQPPSLGPSERLDIKFYGLFFSQDTLEIGRCHARSKDYYRNSMLGQTVWRYCGYELTLFGDPALPMWENIPTNMTLSHPDTVPVGSETVNITVTSSGSPVEHALVCLYKNGEVHERGYTNSSGQVNLFITTSTAGTMSLTVTAKDHYPYEATIQVYGGGATMPYVILVDYAVVGGNGNGILDPGEDAGIVCTIANVGSDVATNTTGTLRCANSYITLTDSTTNYGTLQIQDTV
ncbi:MAG: C25 family cysteine peptidase, partial [bacterium]